MRVWDDDLCCWICTVCSVAFNDNCKKCSGQGFYEASDVVCCILVCDCCGCMVDYNI